jgi:hypothetical protein
MGKCRPEWPGNASRTKEVLSPDAIYHLVVDAYGSLRPREGRVAVQPTPIRLTHGPRQIVVPVPLGEGQIAGRAGNPCRPGQGRVRKWRSARLARHRRWSRADSRSMCDKLPLAHVRYGTVAG